MCDPVGVLAGELQAAVVMLSLEARSLLLQFPDLLLQVRYGLFAVLQLLLQEFEVAGCRTVLASLLQLPLELSVQRYQLVDTALQLRILGLVELEFLLEDLLALDGAALALERLLLGQLAQLAVVYQRLVFLAHASQAGHFSDESFHLLFVLPVALQELLILLFVLLNLEFVLLSTSRLDLELLIQLPELPKPRVELPNNLLQAVVLVCGLALRCGVSIQQLVYPAFEFGYPILQLTHAFVHGVVVRSLLTAFAQEFAQSLVLLFQVSSIPFNSGVLLAGVVIGTLLSRFSEVLVASFADRSSAQLCLQLLDLLLVELEGFSVGVLTILAMLAQTVLVVDAPSFQLCGLLFQLAAKFHQLHLYVPRFAFGLVRLGSFLPAMLQFYVQLSKLSLEIHPCFFQRDNSLFAGPPQGSVLSSFMLQLAG